MMQPPFKQFVTFLHTTDLAATANFYERTLALPLARDQGTCRIYKISAGGYLGFCAHLEPASPQGVIATLVTEDVDGWHERLRKQVETLIFKTERLLNAGYCMDLVARKTTP